MKCPKCKGPMASLYCDGLQIERCTKCNGLWFDMLDEEQFRAMPGNAPDFSAGEEKIRGMGEEGTVKCPHCGDRMVRMVDQKQPHIAYEFCPGCEGVYFDAGEYDEFRNESITITCERLFAY